MKNHIINFKEVNASIIPPITGKFNKMSLKRILDIYIRYGKHYVIHDGKAKIFIKSNQMKVFN